MKFAFVDSSRRRGISLMEVLMSIFIVSVGLFGVAALLPLAHNQAERGITADRSTLAGKQALREFKARRMADCAMWMPAVSLDPANTGSPLYTGSGHAYCIDPRGEIGGAGGTLGGMTRLTLRSEWPSGAKLLSLAADEIFMLQDDISFELPTDSTQPPVQLGTVKRQSKGDFSWMATLVRPGPGDYYNLSIVVFNKRVALNQEFTGNITFLTNPSYGGGEATLTGTAAQNAVVGQWLLVSAGTAPNLTCHWYKIISAARPSASRQVTLAGADWTIAGAANATFIPGAVAVYERTIRLDTPNQW